MDLDDLNALTDERAVEELTTCCGSPRWAREMAARRPFDSVDDLLLDADAVFEILGPSDWLDAFAAHPRIGDRPPSSPPGENVANVTSAAAWSAAEQSGVADAARAMFERRNRDYESRFGHTFIICATGRTGDEMLKILEQRMLNNPEDESRQAAREQRQITRLRLGKLLAGRLQP
jgi:OHCU decarboxylase